MKCFQYLSLQKKKKVKSHLHWTNLYFFLPKVLTIAVPLDFWFEALDIRTDDNRAAQTHRLTFSAKRYLKLVNKFDFEPGSEAMWGNTNCTREKSLAAYLFFYFMIRVVSSSAHWL